MDQLRELAERYHLKADKLLKKARSLGIPVTPAQAKQAVALNTGQQVLKPPARSTGKTAAEGPGSRLQADLIDFSQNTDAPHKYSLLIADVYTRMLYQKTLKSKDAETVADATEEIMHDVPGHGENATLLTDKGNEFKRVDGIHGLIHRERPIGDTNALAVVDRKMQQVKRVLAEDAKTARKDGNIPKWDSAIHGVVDAVNHTDSSAVHGEPANVNNNNARSFLVLQDNSRAFAHDKQLTDSRKAKITEAGAYRHPISDGGRSFNPRYSDQVHQVDHVEPGAQYVVDSTGHRNLLKLQLPVPKASADAPKNSLTVTRQREAPREGTDRERETPMTHAIPLPKGHPLEVGYRPKETASSGSGFVGPRPPVDEPKAAHPISAFIASYVPKSTPEERAFKAKAVADKKAAAAKVAKDKKDAKLNADAEKEFLKQKKQVAKAFS